MTGNGTRDNARRSANKSMGIKALMLLSSGLTGVTGANIALAQDDEPDEIVVEGLRRTIQGAIDIKRENTTIVDGLSADEIGDLPALSIAEALEQITAVGSQREGSGATEVSIRGLGPFLGSTVINGREATNGSGDRSVNFSQFPSELFNKIEVYKTQEASLIEGGVAGQIALSTLKPLEYGKRRIQLQAKGNIQPDNLNITREARDRTVGFRFTGSYVDQWESDTFGEFGISVGGQIQRRPNSEQENRSTSTFQACRIPLLDGNSCNDTESFRTFVEQEFEDDDLPSFNIDNLDAFSDQEVVDTFLNLPSEEFDGATFGEAFIDDPDVQAATEINPFTGQPFGVDEPFVITSSSRSLRQNITDDARDSIFGAVQWRPNDRLEINADVQYSDRLFTEIRNEVVFETNDIEPEGDSAIIPGFELQTTESGALRTATATGPVEIRTQTSDRFEEYVGFGGNIAYDVTERLKVAIDGSYSDTSRREIQLRGRVSSTQSVDTGIAILQDGSQGAQFTVVDFDVNDPSLFTGDNAEVQEDLNQFRNHGIWAVKADAEYIVDNGFFSTFKAGARFSRQTYDQLPRVRNELELDDNDFLNGLFPAEFNGVPVVATIELDVSTDDEEDLAQFLGIDTDLDQNNFSFSSADAGLTGVVPGFTDENGVFIPGSTATFVIDSNGDVDVTATAAEFNRLGFLNDNDTDNLNENFSNLGALAAEFCARDQFVESGFLDGEFNGNLITNQDDDGNIIEAGTGSTFLTFDGATCLAEALIGRELVAPGPEDANVLELTQSVDIREETIAFYAQADFDTTINEIPVRGNIGLRYVDTTLTSTSFRGGFDVDVDDDGNIIGLDVSGNVDDIVVLTEDFSYDEFLPSVNAVAEVSENVLLRGGVFRALSRPDPSSLGNGRTFNTLNLDETTGEETIADFVGAVIANGNPSLEPFTSWNFDLAAEWYPNADSILAVGAYYKVFNGGFENSLQAETFTINGEDITVNVPVQTTSDETSTIFGIEVNAAHAFTYLPGLLGGLGFKASYNYADSDFEFEDGQFGEAVTLDQNGEIISVRQGFIPPANLIGLSAHTANGQIYWNVGNASLSAIGKYRSEFFQQFIGTPLNLRFIDDAFVLDARLSYKINKNLKFSLEGTNLLNTAREQFNPTLDNFAEINVFGPRFFAGLTAKF